MIDSKRFTRDEDGEIKPRTDFYISDSPEPMICPGCEQNVSSELSRDSYAPGVRIHGQPYEGWHNKCVEAKEGDEMYQELADLNDAREILLVSVAGIPGTGADWQKAKHAMEYIDRQREPLLKALLADPEGK